MNTNRLRNGQYATAIESERDHAKGRIAFLSAEAEKWYRAYQALADANARLEKQVRQLTQENKLLLTIKQVLL